MFHNIDHEVKIIEMNRGDDEDFLFTINIGTPLWPVVDRLEDDEAVYLGITEYNQPWEEAIIRKKYTKEDMDAWGRIHMHIASEDTENIKPGIYYYEIKGYLYDAIADKFKTKTIIPRTRFILHE